jgi:hypothetical protein
MPTPTPTSPRCGSRPSCWGCRARSSRPAWPPLERYLAGVRPELRCTPAAAESMGYLLDPPGLDEDIAELWQDIRDAAIAALPGWARDLYGYPAPGRRSTAERRTEIRQALGVLDAVFMAEPGVLEARQRLALRMRSARDRGTGFEGWAAEAGVSPLVGGRARRSRRCAAATATGPARGPGRQPAGRAGADRAAAGRARRRALREQRAAAVRQRRASTGSSCGTTWRCRPPRTSPPPWAR